MGTEINENKQITFNVNLIDNSYKKIRNIYKLVLYPNDIDVSIKAYYKTEKSRGSELCYHWHEKDKFRFKSSYEEFIVDGLTDAIIALRNSNNIV